MTDSWEKFPSNSFYSLWRRRGEITERWEVGELKFEECRCRLKKVKIKWPQCVSCLEILSYLKKILGNLKSEKYHELFFNNSDITNFYLFSYVLFAQWCWTVALGIDTNLGSAFFSCGTWASFLSPYEVSDFLCTKWRFLTCFWVVLRIKVDNICSI